MKNTDKSPNKLINESSPYLLQHAYNPVNWLPWGNEALQKAVNEDKPIIVSIGYSACHWCHVMERESFENEELASLMNKNYVCIKVDREERPDVDAIYMDSLQSMGLQGGWPLNVFLTPEAKPFYGGTYFPPQHWSQLLNNIAEAYKSQKEEILKSADGFASELNFSEVKKYGLTNNATDFEIQELDLIYEKLAKRFDEVKGGSDRSPKFPMPSIYLFLLRYFQISKNEKALIQTRLTLNEIAFGGIYDQVGGGFARYSTDADWFAPHFEKMLYDNGQLVSLYSEAYTLTKDSLYKEVVYQTVSWLKREMVSAENGFYSALDADSEGIEGKFYVWNFEEFQDVLDTLVFSDGILPEHLIEYFGVEKEGNWEHDYNILHVKMKEDSFAKLKNLPLDSFQNTIKNLKKSLLIIRAERIRPGLDDKILCSWNGLMMKGLVDAFRAFNEPEFLDLAIKNAVFLKEKLRNGHQLFHSYKNGKATICGYLEDYAFVIDGYTALYQVTFDEKWLNEAKILAGYAIEHFYDKEEELFFFTDSTSEKLIARKKEIFDNVIPASNSAMAKNLYFLGILIDKEKYIEISVKMISRMKKLILTEPNYLTNWACLFTSFTQPTAEIAIVGNEIDQFRNEIDLFYFPNKIITATKTESGLPLLENREAIDDKTTVYVCYNKTCKFPVFTVEEVIKELQEV